MSVAFVRRGKRSRGQSLVEFAVVLPVALLVVMLAVDFGRAFMGWVSLTGATRVAANYASTHPTANWGSSTDPDRQRYQALILTDLSTTNCPLAAMALPTFSPDTNVGSTATVTLTCSFRFITPMIITILGNQMSMTSSTAYPIRTGEYAPPAPPPSVPPSPSPSDSSSPSPSPCVAPNFINQRVNDAPTIWRNAGFTTTVLTKPGIGNYKIGEQDKVAGQKYSCDTTIVTVGPPVDPSP